MPVLRRELASNTSRPTGSTGDWWHLVLDTENPGLWIEHTWSRASPHSDSAIDRGEQRFGINDFLTLTEGQPAQPALLIALRDMFREPLLRPDEGGEGSFSGSEG